MLPSEHLNYFFFKFMHRLGVLTGCEYMVPTFKTSWRTAMFTLVFGLGVFAMAYTLLTKDRMLAMKCSTTVGVTFQGAVKYIVFLSNTRSMCGHVAYLQRVYRQCDSFRAEALRLIDWAKISKKGIVIYMCIFGLTEAGFCALPLYIYATTGDMVLLLPILVPGFDETTPSGFLGQTVCQFTFMLMMLFGMAGSDTTIFLFIIQICPLSEMIMLKLRVLKDGLRHYDVEIRSDAEHRRMRAYLLNIVRMHAEFVEYVGEISDMFYVLFMVEIMFDGLGMCLIMFVQMQEIWFPLYMFWIVYFFKTFLFCSMGTMAEYYVSVVGLIVS